MSMDLTQLRDEYARVRASADAAPRPTESHAHLSHRRLPLTPLTGVRSRLLTGWAVVSTPVILLVAALIAAPWLGWDITSASVLWLFGLMLLEGFLRGHFLGVLARIVIGLLLLSAVYWLVVDWRIVLAVLLGGAGLLLLVVNLRDALKR